MSEKFQDVIDPEGNLVCRIIDNPEQRPTEYPYWVELAKGYRVQEGKQGCHDRREAQRLKVRLR